MASFSSSAFSTSAFSTSAFDFDVAVVATAEVPSAGNIDWLKRRKKTRLIKRSEYSSIEEYQKAMTAAMAMNIAETGIPLVDDDGNERDDEIILTALSRLLH